jgi:metal transporter CNNM
MSGLTVGLLGIDELELEIMLSSGTPEQKLTAKKILGVINNHHLLLVTLLLANSLAMETLPLFLDQLFTPEITIILSVTLVLAFGEVIPQAFCTGPNQIKIARCMVPVVQVLVVLFFPISYPISKALDYILSHSQGSVKLKSDDLKTFISLHESFNQEKPSEVEGLERYQIVIMHGAIDMNKHKVKNYMEFYSNFVCLDIEALITTQTFQIISKSNYHYLPVYRNSIHNLVGIIALQELFKAQEGDTIESLDLAMADAVKIDSIITLSMALKEMDSRKTTISFVMQDIDGEIQVVGVVTKEMILKKMIQDSSLTERNEIAEISHAIIENFSTRKRLKTISSLREHLI